jgi:hypothetical protein
VSKTRSFSYNVVGVERIGLGAPLGTFVIGIVEDEQIRAIPQTVLERSKADPDCMSVDNRIAPRHVFEVRILIRFRQGNRNTAAHGWVRDLSESGLGAFVAEPLVVGETVGLLLSLPTIGKEEIPARVARQLGTQYGFQFTALSQEQRASIRTALSRRPVIPYSDEQNISH